jgi:hypothetical protein
MSFFKKDGSQLRRDPTGGYRYVGDLTQGSALTGVCVGTGPAPPALRSPNNLTGAQGAFDVAGGAGRYGVGRGCSDC